MLKAVIDLKTYLENIFSTILDLTGIDIDISLVLEILEQATSLADFFVAIIQLIFDMTGSLLPNDLKDSLEWFMGHLQEIESPRFDWEKIQYFLLHGHKCIEEANFLESCYKNVSSLNFETPAKEEILLQSW